MKTKKLCAGEYEVSESSFSVSISKHDFGWIAKADWTNGLFTDPLDTKREAVYNAAAMIKEAQQ